MNAEVKRDELLRRERRLDIFTGIALAAFAAIVYFLSLASYAYPGESARLQALWRGLDVSSESFYPLMKICAAPFGASNIIAPVLGILAVFLFYRCTLLFIRSGAFCHSNLF